MMPGHCSEEEAEAIVMELFNIGKHRNPEFLCVFPGRGLEAKRVEAERCCICLEDIMGSRAAVKCGHAFHSKCIYSWLEVKRTCPSCRVRVEWNV
ncbi:hypothetical protein [Encephalitozoon cuniculi GB-M1]|uniref:RING-type E3 ubiquitin transferase n=1 Tax=Encephalitozoon cuniculi (strain GB-M1) TaxID=284813 RepID=Q8SU44_ENCCU|nr:uncharacterized protein ECU11_1000 [Encephalitozoon cuniculi GB-M1]CAD26010.2 hypothetical protein [Encephalitozoon cuniculi GB-M1]